MSALTVINTSIRLHDGLYSLNDLHKAAGGEKKHEPNRFVRLEQTKALIDEIEKTPDLGVFPIRRIQGRNGGTYACKELVYAYAMWISAKFHLAVIRAFDAMATGSLPQPEQTGRVTATQPWAFNNIEFNIVNRNGQPWLRMPEIGVALGYGVRHSVHNIHHRHRNAFSDDMTALVQLETESGQQTVRIFSLPGCALIAKFSHTKLAKDFGRWVVDAMGRDCSLAAVDDRTATLPGHVDRQTNALNARTADDMKLTMLNAMIVAMDFERATPVVCEYLDLINLVRLLRHLQDNIRNLIDCDRLIDERIDRLKDVSGREFLEDSRKSAVS